MMKKKIYGRTRSINTNTKIVLAAMIALLLYIFFMPSHIAAAETQTATDYSGYRTAFEGTDVMDDLSGYDLSKYAGSNTISMIMLTEFGYQRQTMSGFGIYCYIYNDTGNPLIDYGRNMIQMSLDGEHYDKYHMTILDKSDDNKVYKIKISDKSQSGNSILADIVGHNTRSYTVSGMELLTSKGLVDYAVAHTFKYTGAASFDEDVASTLQCVVEDQDVVVITGLEDRQTVYRTDMDNQNMNRHNQVNSVYFGVDNAIIEKYGQLQQIEAEWWEYRTKPIMVLNNEDVYNELLSNIHGYIGSHNCNYDYAIEGDYYDEGNQFPNRTWMYNDWYSTDPSIPDGQYLYLTSLPWIFATDYWGQDLDNYLLTEDRIQKYREEYEKKGDFSDVDEFGFKYCTDLFDEDVGSGRTAGYNHKFFNTEDPNSMINFTAYDPAYSGWDALKHLFGWNDDFEEVLKDQSPIVLIDSTEYAKYKSKSHEQVAKELLIADEDVAAFLSYAERCIEYDQTVVLFRFACTTYEAFPVRAYKYSGHTTIDHQVPLAKGTVGFSAEENVFLNFDIMTLGFYNGEKMTIIPVVSSPVDIISDVVGPALPDLLPWGDPEWGLMDYIYFGLMVVAAVLIFVVLYGILDMISNSVMRAPARNNYKRKKRRR